MTCLVPDGMRANPKRQEEPGTTNVSSHMVLNASTRVRHVARLGEIGNRAPFSGDHPHSRHPVTVTCSLPFSRSTHGDCPCPRFERFGGLDGNRRMNTGKG